MHGSTLRVNGTQIGAEAVLRREHKHPLYELSVQHRTLKCHVLLVTTYRELSTASRPWLSPATFNRATEHLRLIPLLIAVSLVTQRTVAVAQTNSRPVREPVQNGQQNAPPAIDIQKSAVPPDIDEYVPPASHEPCPLAAILEGANKRAEELVLNVQRFTATEILQS